MINHSKLKASLLMAVVFLLGAIVGASLGTAIVSKKFASPPGISESHKREKILEKFKSRLSLTLDQTEKVRAILDETHQQFSDLHESIRPQAEEIRNRMRQSVRELLNEGQKKEFEVMTQEYDQQRVRESSK